LLYCASELFFCDGIADECAHCGIGPNDKDHGRRATDAMLKPQRDRGARRIRLLGLLYSC
jgi:hypothetical protein